MASYSSPFLLNLAKIGPEITQLWQYLASEFLHENGSMTSSDVGPWTVGHASGQCSAAQWPRLLRSKVKVAQSTTVGGGILAETSLVILRERNFAMATVTQWRRLINRPLSMYIWCKIETPISRVWRELDSFCKMRFLQLGELVPTRYYSTPTPCGRGVLHVENGFFSKI